MSFASFAAMLMEGAGAAGSAISAGAAGIGEGLSSLAGSATPQAAGAGIADNMIAGGANSGWGSLAQDLAGGNYASAAGNAMQMGRDNKAGQEMSQAGAQPMAAPAMPMGQSPVPNPGIPSYGQAQSPMLQTMMQRYMGGR